MDRALVIVEPSDTGRELLTIAGDIAAGTETELVLVRAIDRSDFDRDVQRKGQTSMEGIDSIDDLETKAREEAAELGEDELDGTVPYTPVGLVGDLPDDLLTLAAERDCDHVFIAGEKRSPTGKVLFGDDTQSVLLNFDGPVTSLIR